MQPIDHKIWIQKFNAFEAGLNGQATGPLRDLRRKAIAQFERMGYPTSADEAWKTINPSPLTRPDFQPAPAYVPGSIPKSHLDAFRLPGAYHLVFVNGYVATDLSDIANLPKGIQITTLSDALASDPDIVLKHLSQHADGTAFAALNTAFIRDGAFVRIPKNTVAEKPIHLLFVSTAQDIPTASHPRALIVAEPGSQATLIETYAGLDGAYLTNAVTEIVAGDNTVIDHYKLELESPNGLHLSHARTVQGRSANTTSHAFSLGGAFVRNDISAHLQGEGGEATINGLYVLENNQILDNYTLLEHAEPHCPSHELYKGILGGQARSVFRGKIHVHQKAQKTDAYQQNQNILLSDDARVNTKPQLEIYADDVKCSHGATIGQLDDTALFYLQARGIGKNEARHMLLKAFADDIVERVKPEALRTRINDLVNTKLERMFQAEP